MTDITRRRFVKTIAGTGAAFTILPRHVLGRGFRRPATPSTSPPSASAAWAAAIRSAVMSQNIVAFCDVDDTQSRSGSRAYKRQRSAAATRAAAAATDRHVHCRRRKSTANQRRPATDEMADLRSFVDGRSRRCSATKTTGRCSRSRRTSTRSSSRRPITCTPRLRSAAMDLGKHVYVQKPLCWSVEEARHLAPKAKSNPKLVDADGQPGTLARRGPHRLRIHPAAARSATCARCTSGRIVRSATGRRAFRARRRCRPTRRTPLPLERPWRRTAARGGDGRQLSRAARPAWDLFLGVAPDVDYHPVYHPFNWRGWVDWGQGALGDMGAHLIDHPFWALNLGMPTVDRNVVDAVQRRLLPACDDDATIEFAGARQHAAGEADVVRRRLAAAEAGGDRRREAERRGRRAATSAARAS